MNGFKKRLVVLFAAALATTAASADVRDVRLGVKGAT